ncbi:calcium-binding protein [Paracoccus pacificus]|uniref:Calcium-binding protein n=1 Tax=Paracoccus pacificus TaxID=1463598 RepID=A0ABW4R7A3_9RHOB
MRKILGTKAGEKLVGYKYNDFIVGNGGNDSITGGGGDDYIRAIGSGGLLSGQSGNDIIYAQKVGFGQFHMYGGEGNDTLILDMTNSKMSWGHQGHHVYGGSGSDKFVFQNIAKANHLITGRIDDFDNSRDSIWLGGQKLDLSNLPANVRVVEMHGQQWLSINDKALYNLEGPRQMPGGEETHFVHPSANPASLPTVKFIDQVNYVPYQLYKNGESSLNSMVIQDEAVINGTKGADYIYATHTNNAYHNNKISAGNGNDVVNANRGFDTVHGGAGNDKIAGGEDADILYGDSGRDALFGGSGNDRIFGGLDNDMLYGSTGRDFLNGGGGNDLVQGGLGNDTLLGAAGSDTLEGGAGSDRFVFRDWTGKNTVVDFQQGIDKLDVVGLTTRAEFASDIQRVQIGKDVLVSFDDSDMSVLIKNTTVHEIWADDFIM